MIGRRGGRGCGLAAALAALLVLTFAGRAAAQDEDAVYAAYGAYQAALQSGDMEAASAKAEESWRLAEATWGDHENTAVLAYNYASFLATTGDFLAARESARRVLSLDDAGLAPATVPTREAELILGLGELSSDERREKSEGRNRLEDLLSSSGGTPTRMSALANLLMARDCVANHKWNRSLEYAEAAERELEETLPDASLLLAETVFLKAVSHLYEGDPLVSEASLIQASRLLRDPDAYGSIEPNLSHQISGWHAAIHAFAGTKDIELPPHEVQSAVLELKRDRPTGCFEWSKRKSADYPESRVREGGIGAVLSSIDLAPDGSVAEHRILASVGGPEFGREVAAAVSSWTATIAPGASSECLKDIRVDHIFQIESGGRPKRIR